MVYEDLSFVQCFFKHISDEANSDELPSILHIAWSASSVSCPVDRKAHDEQCLPLASVSKGCTSLLQDLVYSDVCVDQHVVVVGWLVALRPSNMPVYLRDGSAQTVLRVATLR